MVISRDELARLPADERAELATALAELSAADISPASRVRRQLFLIGCVVAVVGLAGWTIGLGLTLPPHQEVGQWRLAWVGFDVAELIALSVVAWAAWQRRQLLIPATLISGTLLLCDAWFDVVLSWQTPERWQSILSAAVIEVPLAVGLWWLSRALVLRTVRMARARFGISGPPPAMHALELFIGLTDVNLSNNGSQRRRA
jgi:hypothetical protein